jgi:hypothetical protein
VIVLLLLPRGPFLELSRPRSGRLAAAPIVLACVPGGWLGGWLVGVDCNQSALELMHRRKGHSIDRIDRVHEKLVKAQTNNTNYECQ